MTYENNAFPLPSPHSPTKNGKSSRESLFRLQQLHSQLFLSQKYFAQFQYHSSLHPAFCSQPIPNASVLFHYPNGVFCSREIPSLPHTPLLVSRCYLTSLRGTTSSSSSCFTALLTSAPALLGSGLLLTCRIILHFLSSAFLPPGHAARFFPRSGTEPCTVSFHRVTNGRI